MNWTEQSLNVNTSLTKQNILVCEDANLDSFPIRTASHIIHFSLPNELQTFLYRFITCFGYYAEKLDRELLNKPDSHELNPPICLTYFDEEMCDEFIQIYDVLSNRTQTEMPADLNEFIEVRNVIHLNANLLAKEKTVERVNAIIIRFFYVFFSFPEFEAENRRKQGKQISLCSIDYPGQRLRYKLSISSHIVRL